MNTRKDGKKCPECGHEMCVDAGFCWDDTTYWCTKCGHREAVE